MPKSEWNAGLVRSLWAALENCMAQRRTSADYEETWLILAGFLLRPGFGAAGDDLRIDSLWRLRDGGLCFPGKRIKSQDTFFGGGWRVDSRSNVRSISSHPSWTAPRPEQSSTRAYPARRIVRMTSCRNED